MAVLKNTGYITNSKIRKWVLCIFLDQKPREIVRCAGGTMKTTTAGTIILTSLCLVILTAAGALAGGQDIFINKCGACHKTGGGAPVFAPTKYASRQWVRFFERNTHKRKKDISRDFTPNELQRVETYLIDHAADSDQPVAIGLR